MKDLTQTATALGFDLPRLSAAIDFAFSHESTINRDIETALNAGLFEEPMPLGAPIGPCTPRGGPCGLVLRHGEVAASWGDIDRADMTFSISKSYLALVAGIAEDKGMIPDIHAPVSSSVADPAFADPQNVAITWAHQLHLTSEWQGTLWGKPDWIDHYRDLNATGDRPPIGTRRPLQPAGTYWEYNDVRVNCLALALTHVFRQSLGDVLKAHIMSPLGASNTWTWHGYDTSWINIDGTRIQSVSGGAHWGGGLWISAKDHALVGQLMLQNGMWQGGQVISPDWVKFCRTPSPLNPNYGALWWLNTDRNFYAGASPNSFFGLGVGTQILWVDPEHDMVVIARWIEKEHVPRFVSLVSEAVRPH